MQNYNKHNKILGQCTPNSHTHRREIIKLVRSEKRFSIKNIKKNLWYPDTLDEYVLVTKTLHTPQDFNIYKVFRIFSIMRFSTF